MIIKSYLIDCHTVFQDLLLDVYSMRSHINYNDLKPGGLFRSAIQVDTIEVNTEPRSKLSNEDKWKYDNRAAICNVGNKKREDYETLFGGQITTRITQELIKGFIINLKHHLLLRKTVHICIFVSEYINIDHCENGLFGK